MNGEFSARRLDVAAFAKAAATLEAEQPLTGFPRLMREQAVDAPSSSHAQTTLSQPPPALPSVGWRATGELRGGDSGSGVPWLRLQARVTMSVVCQRCLAPMACPVDVDRWFRFVVDEATAEAEDEDAQEDVLVLSRQFDLPSLVEDELLLALPPVPRHAHCPAPPALSAHDAAFKDAAKPHPFAGLAALASTRLKNPDK
ncbi:MAG: DUF177 domain-containing protein [Variovorax sp.]